MIKVRQFAQEGRGQQGGEQGGQVAEKSGNAGADAPHARAPAAQGDNGRRDAEGELYLIGAGGAVYKLVRAGAAPA